MNLSRYCFSCIYTYDEIVFWDSEKESQFRDTTRTEILSTFNHAETVRKPAVDELFTDVYDVVCNIPIFIFQ